MRRRMNLFVEHPPVFTLGLNGKRELCWHLAISRWCKSTAAAGDYHGPAAGGVPADRSAAPRLGRARIGRALEDAVIDYAAELGVTASAGARAPGSMSTGETRQRGVADSPRPAITGWRSMSRSIWRFPAHQCVRISGAHVRASRIMRKHCFARRRRRPAVGGRGLTRICCGGLNSAPITGHQHRFAGSQLAVDGVELFAAGGMHHVGQRQKISSAGRVRTFDSRHGAGVPLDDGLGQRAANRMWAAITLIGNSLGNSVVSDRS